MLRTYILVMSALLTSWLLASAAITIEDTKLTEEQKALQAEIEHSLVSPCCWNMTVDQHDSPASRQVREQISELIKAGKSKKEVLNFFTSQPQYGERILAAPSQDTLLGKAAYWLIPIAMLFGALVVYKSIRKWTAREKPAAQTATQPNISPNEAGSTDVDLSKRIEDELKKLDA